MLLGRVLTYTKVFGGGLSVGNNGHNLPTTSGDGSLLWRTIEMAWKEQMLPVKDLWKHRDSRS